jgi:hypothetical protein
MDRELLGVIGTEDAIGPVGHGVPFELIHVDFRASGKNFNSDYPEESPIGEGLSELSINP